MRKLLILSAALAPLALAPLTLAGPAFASNDEARCPEVPRAEWQGLGAIESALAAKGYTVREIEVDGNCYEVEGTDANGAKFEAYVNPKTGEIVPAKQRS
jgi:hypothetical protein